MGLVGNYDRKMMGDRDRADWLEGELKRQEAREQQVEQSMHSVREEFERRQAVRYMYSGGQVKRPLPFESE